VRSIGKVRNKRATPVPNGALRCAKGCVPEECSPDVNRAIALEGKLKTAWRIDFTPDVSLYLNPTWDLDEFGSRRTFDGGNVQFRARLF